MEFHTRTVELAMAPAEVAVAILGKKHVRFIEGHDNFFSPPAAVLDWSVRTQGRLESSLSYFRSKNLCVFRVFADLQENGSGTTVRVSSGHGPWSSGLMIAAWILGIGLCVVGAIIPFLQTKAYSYQLRLMVESVGDALEAMDREGRAA